MWKKLLVSLVLYPEPAVQRVFVKWSSSCCVNFKKLPSEFAKDSFLLQLFSENPPPLFYFRNISKIIKKNDLFDQAALVLNYERLQK